MGREILRLIIIVKERQSLVSYRYRDASLSLFSSLILWATKCMWIKFVTSFSLPQDRSLVILPAQTNGICHLYGYPVPTSASMNTRTLGSRSIKLSDLIDGEGEAGIASTYIWDFLHDRYMHSSRIKKRRHLQTGESIALISVQLKTTSGTCWNWFAKFDTRTALRVVHS